MDTFEKTYHDNYNVMYRIAIKMLGNGSDVTDILQDVFMSFFEKQQQRKRVEYPRSWLCRATLNKCVDKLRKEKKFTDAEPAPDTEDKSICQEKQEMKALMSYCLTRLSPREKELVILYSEGLSYKELAQVTGIAFTSIGKTLSRSLKKLENELKTHGYEVFK